MKDVKKEKNAFLAAAFIMATSAIGPGFLTQTVQFSAEYLTSLGFVIVCVIIMDFVVQMNIWSVIGATGLHGQEIANRVLPVLGTLLTLFISIGGLSFNIGNISGALSGLKRCSDSMRKSPPYSAELLRSAFSYQRTESRSLIGSHRFFQPLF